MLLQVLSVVNPVISGFSDNGLTAGYCVAAKLDLVHRFAMTSA